MQTNYDIIIIGGRPAGASLAIRLNDQNLKILLIDRATFPSWPSVPSSPMVHPGTMRLLDELGISEQEYTHPDGKMTRMVMDVMGHFQVVMKTELLDLDRNYFYGIDRNKFDMVLWKKAASLPNVTARENVSMLDVTRSPDGAVTGVVCKTDSGETQTFSASLIVGADGRFSTTATRLGAKVIEERNQFPSASYHAEWENVGPYSEAYPQPFMLYQLPNNYSFLCIPIDRQKYIIGNYMRTDHTQFTGSPEERYLQALETAPRLKEMLKNARRTTPVVGVRVIENGYREAFGNGWALVGDAFHYESPLDGQGIYNALLASSFLADAIAEWKQGKPWQEAGHTYQQRFYNATHDMLEQTVKRVEQELYTTPPPFVVKNLMRWVLTDQEYQKQFLRYLSRALEPKSFVIGPTPGPLVRGFLRDLGMLKR